MKHSAMTRFAIILAFVLFAAACIDSGQVGDAPKSDNQPDTLTVALHVEGMT